MILREKPHRVFFTVLLLTSLILSGCGNITLTPDIKTSEAPTEGQCVTEAKLVDSESRTVPPCPGGLKTGGGFGFKVYVEVTWGSDGWRRHSWNTCRVGLEPWKAELAKAPYADLLMEYTSLSNNPKACPASYENLGSFNLERKCSGCSRTETIKGAGTLCARRGQFPDLSGTNPLPTDLTLPLVEDFQLLSCLGCSTAPTCPENYVERGSFMTGAENKRVGQTFCVKYNLACACRTPDQCKAMCESTDAATPMPNPPEGYPTGAGGGFAVDGGPGVWVKETPELTPPFNGALPPLPPKIVLDGTSDPFFLRLLRPDGTVFSGVYVPGEEAMTASVDSVLNQKGNCCLDGDECEPICTRNDPAGVWLAEAEPFFSGVKLFEDPKFGKCVETGLGVMLRSEGEFGGEKTCGHIINGPCCGDDDKGNAWYYESGGDCTDTQDGQKQLCVSTAPDGEHAWKSAADAATQGEEEIFRPLCQAGEMDIREGKWHWIMETAGGCNGHRVTNCGFKSNEKFNPGHEPQITGMFGGDEKKAGSPCVDEKGVHPHHRVSFCGETDNDEADGGINFAVDELARFWCGFTYCRSTNTFGKDLDGKYLDDCESFPIIKVKEGIQTPWGDTTVTENNLVNTGTYCCGEVDDDDPSTPFDGEFYNDVGGKGACFINYQPNGAFVQHNVKIANLENMKYYLGASMTGKIAIIQGALYIADGRQVTPNVIKGDTSTQEDKSLFVFNGTILGCSLDRSYNPDNDYLVDIKDSPNWAKGKKFKDTEVPIHDPTEGGAQEPDQNDTPANQAGEAKKGKKKKQGNQTVENVIRQQPHCSKTGPAEDIQKYYCSYTEQWLERNETERDTLKSIAWKAEDTLISQTLTPPLSNETNETLSPATSRNRHYLILGNQSNETNITSTNESLQKYLFLDRECCGITQCWDGYQCVDDQAGKPDDPVDPYTLLENGDGFRCLNGVWKPALLKYTPDGSESGYCPRNDQCLYDLEGNESQNDLMNCGNECAPQCIASSQYLEDDYCDNGTWTSRTRLLAKTLLDKTRVELDAKDYTLFCDQPSLTLNNLQNPGNVNNDCALQFDEPNVLGGTERHVLLGATYNGDRNAFLDALRQSLILSYDNLDANSSEVQNLGGGCMDNDDYRECATLSDRNDNDVLHLYHHGPLRIVVMSGKSVPGFNTNPILDLFTFLKDLFRTLLGTTQSTAELSDFKRLYLSGLAPQRIYGVAETLFSVNKSTNKTKIFDDLYTIEYVGYKTDFNTLLGGVTAETKHVTGEAGNQTVLLVNPSQDLWRQFTEQLRPKRVEEEPEE